LAAGTPGARSASGAGAATGGDAGGLDPDAAAGGAAGKAALSFCSGPWGPALSGATGEGTGAIAGVGAAATGVASSGSADSYPRWRTFDLMSAMSSRVSS